MNSILSWLGISPSPEERKTLLKLRYTGAKSMKVVGRGTLTMSAEDAKSTRKAKRFIQELDHYVK